MDTEKEVNHKNTSTVRKVISITDTTSESIEPIRLLSRKQMGGWRNISKSEQQRYLARATKVVHLGSCKKDGDMFALYTIDGYIMIFKGKLNSGHHI